MPTLKGGHCCGWDTMDRERFIKILQFNANNEKDIGSFCNQFYSLLGRSAPFVITDIQALARTVFMEKGYHFIHIPLVDTEIGAYQLKLNGNKYLVVNTSKSLANNNFAVAHELYHLLIQSDDQGDGEEVYIDTYEYNNNEMMANAFAGNILMPVDDFILTAERIKRNMADYLKHNEDYIYEIATILGLMVYYRTTYMAVAIRCFETRIMDYENNALVKFILDNNDEEVLRGIFDDLGTKMGADSIMRATKEDDYRFLLGRVEGNKEKYIQEGFLTEEDYSYRLAGLNKAYQHIRRED